MRKCLPVFVFILLLSQSCLKGADKDQVWQNDKIDSKLRATLALLNDQAYNSMCQNSYGKLSQLFSDSLLQNITPDFTQKFMPQMQKVMKGRKYRVFDEFYVKNIKADDTVNISSGTGDNAYSMKFIAHGKETYLAMLVTEDSVNEVMLTLVYINVEGQWKVFNLTGEDYSVDRRNAVEQYRYAQALQKNGYLMNAVNRMGLSNNSRFPGGRIFKYKKQEEMKVFSDSLTNQVKAKYPFPYTVNELKSKPLVVNIHLEVEKGNFVPMIVYQSSINISDTIALKKENDEMQENIGKIFYGMDKNTNAILYRAYNELPNGQNSPQYYGYIQKIM